MIETIKEWCKNWVGYYALKYELEEKNDILKKQINELLDVNNELVELVPQIEDLQAQLEETQTQLTAANEEIFYLTDFIDIDNFKSWYISRWGTRTWSYNWDNKGPKPVNQAFRYKDNNTGPQKLIDLKDEIINRYNMESPSKTEIIERVKQYFTVRNHWTYVYDHANPLHPGVADYWQEIDVSIDRRRGDCEDLAILMHMTIRTMFDEFGYEDDKWRVVFTAGTMIGYGGHAYNLYLHNDGHYYVIESTFDLEGSFKRAWLKTPLVYNNLYQNVWGFANPAFSRQNFMRSDNLRALKKELNK